MATNPVTRQIRSRGTRDSTRERGIGEIVGARICRDDKNGVFFMVVIWCCALVNNGIIIPND